MIKKLILRNYTNYFVSDEGEVFRKTRKFGMLKLKTFHRNRKDKQMAVKLIDNQGERKNYPVKFIVLCAFRGNRPKEYICCQRIKDPNNCRIDNLHWEVRKDISLFEILSDDEFRIYQKKLNGIATLEETKKFNKQCLSKYLSFSCKNIGIRNGSYFRKRMIFFKQTFK